MNVGTDTWCGRALLLLTQGGHGRKRLVSAHILDVNFLARQAELHGYFDHLDIPTLAILARDLALFSSEKIIYDQIRLIAINGEEVIRINNHEGNSIIVDAEYLQNKAQRYYFWEALQLNRNEIYISPFDLNVEHDKIQIPIKPVIRFATPVFDSNGA